ncbi:50S ribosomal protein L4 [Candidatus Protochlamydia phocaeensis]|uniref:50S ribosomal protein L4 n=1 Tax=Candidatus Protochlamydia phocaeensis TaxID=1414722 RepID=UPI00083912E3|nr:50S ribosomal protein L4 [Candidatus Protochlamydia phocaeensis]
MATLKKYNLAGKEVGQVTINEELINAEANSQMVKDYIIALRANARQWSANTKTRSEVKHTTKKPHPQKGQGRARHGSLVGPQFRGGGRVFGPKPKFDQHVRINKKERKAAIRFLIAEKLRENKVWLIDDTAMDAPKTQTIAQFLKGQEMRGRILFLGEGAYAEIETEGKVQRVSVSSDKHDNFIKSMRNLPRADFMLACNISGYDVMIAREIVLTESALNELNQWLS